ncbi:molybdopterin-dependent oxidoreductase [Candidatus Woesearchaeota archaeon]|nr:molybdopterin-dependent oxidoreductase [Candidatus Woesearchaeota archaeon]
MNIRAALSVIIVLTALLGITGCAPPYSDFTKLKEVEVKEYQGERLDSITDAFDTSIKGPQYVNISEYTLSVTGLVENPGEYTYDEVLGHSNYSKVVTLRCVEGWNAKILWDGILVEDLLKEVKPLPDANTVIFYSYDGYTTSLPLDYIVDNDIILAHSMNGVTMPPSKGFPFQLIAEQKWGYKWAKWVTKIELSNNSDYMGYWEKRGWDQDADIEDGPRVTR